MKLTDRPKWKKIVIAVVCIAALLTAVSSSYAAYTSQAYKRGVARNRDNETVRFTSNYLQNCAEGTQPSEYAGRTILFEESEKEKDTLTINLDIYNYANGNLNLVSQKDITYNLQVSFSGGDGNGYSVTYENDSVTTTDSVTYTIDNTLTGRTANQHHYVLSFPGKELDKLKITVTATPVPVSVNNGQILAAVIAPCTGSSTNAFSFEGKYTDESESTTPQDYSGFNYEISISSGSATATLKWKSAVLEVDQFFITKIKNAGSIIKQADGSLTFTMDQPKGTGDYLIPFYIKDKSKVPDNWAGMKELITFSAKQTETAAAN